MAKKCILCDKLAGSKEHIFPAALGGRRVDKGIYCEQHNNQLGQLADLLSQQLVSINSILGIKSDHTKKSSGVRVIDENTKREYVFAGPRFKLAKPVKAESKTIEGREFAKMEFADKEQMQKWLREQKEAGIDVHISETSSEQQLFATPLRVKMVIGGPKGLQAIAYLAFKRNWGQVLY
ncbi:MAG TPA: hypothetical protein VGO35_10080 [Gammaproteobacteria bacterium]|jgi:hypothetical protein|nr:hypothetical protein [Gammaproteobacteria bacterium]